MNIALGNRVKDIVTGITGIATSEYHHMYGMTQYGVQPEYDYANKKMPEAMYVDECILQVLDIGVANDVPTTEAFKFTFGQEVREIASKQTGFITNILIHLNGCVSFGITSPSVDNKNPEIFFINQNRLELVSEGIFPKETPRYTGGPTIKASSLNVR